MILGCQSITLKRSRLFEKLKENATCFIKQEPCGMRRHYNLRIQAIPYPTDGLEEARLARVFFDSPPQPRNVDIERTRIAGIRGIPNFTEEPGAL